MECGTFLLFALALVSFFVALSARRLSRDLKTDVDRLRKLNEVQASRIDELRQELRRGWRAEAGPPPTPEPEPAAAPAFEPAEPPPSEPIPEPVFEAAAPPPPPESPVEEELPPPPPPTTAPPPPPSVFARGFDWEGLVGVKLFSWIAGVALALAAVFFLRYSIDHGWIGPPVRMALGFTTGIALLIVCELKIANRYRVTANAFDASGVAILFATLYASNAIWKLLPGAVTFPLMVLVTVVAVLLAIRRDSIFIALLGLVGGFATPALLSTGQDRPISLFGYLLLVNAGVALVAYRKRWPVLLVLSVVLTVLYQWSWVLTFLDSGRLPLAAAIFLIFPVLLVFMFLRQSAHAELAVQQEEQFQRTTAASTALPILFAIYAASAPAFRTEFHILFAFLLLVDIGLSFVASSRSRLGFLHPIGAVGTLVVLVVWTARSYTAAAWPEVLIWIAAFSLFYLAAPKLLEGLRRPLHEFAREAALIGPLLLFIFPALPALERATASGWLLFGVLALLVAAAAAGATMYQQPRLIWIAAALAFATEAVWTVKYLDAQRLLTGLTVFGAMALLFLGIAVVTARRVHSLRFVAYMATGAYLLLLAVASDTSLVVPPLPLIAILFLLLLACGLAVLALAEPRLQFASLAGALVVLLTWQITADSSPWPSIQTLVAVATAAFAVTWMFAGRRRFALNVSLTEGLTTPPVSELTVSAVLAVMGSQAAVTIASAVSGRPSFGLILAAHVLLTLMLLGIAAITEWHAVAVLAVVPAAIAAFAFNAASEDVDRLFSEPFTLALTLYLLFSAYPLVLGRRVGAFREPFLAAVLASVPLFFIGRDAIRAAGLNYAVGVLPVFEAAVLVVLLVRLLRIEPRGERVMSRLALVAGAALAFVTVAIPLQLDKEWITIGWALEAAALAWLYTRIPHRGVLLFSAGLFATVFARLVLNREVFSYYPRSDVAIWNWYLYTYLVAAAAFFVGAWFFRRTNDELVEPLPRLSALLPGGGAVLLFLLLNIEIADFYSKGSTLTFNFLRASLAQDLTYTIGWALFAIAMLVFGIFLSNRVARLGAILLLSVTVFKCFLHDLGRLGGLYRVGSFVGLAICLALVALLLQRFVMTPQLKQEVTS